jgi:indole-3-glycerol phosphate synthase
MNNKNILLQICENTKRHVKHQRGITNYDSIISLSKEAPVARGFKKFIRNKIEAGKVALITEVKKASPSKGLIRADFNPAEIAISYEQAGAACISVLTDEKYFQGHDDYLKQVKASVKLPVLRKDFMVDTYQIYESRAIGADCILLIAAALEDDLMHEMENIAHELGMDVLVEVHNAEELERALKLKTELIGVNNRNLKTLEVDINMTKKLAPLVPDNRIIICESGISTYDDIVEMQKVKANTFLVGESLMRQEDISAAVKNLLG